MALNRNSSTGPGNTLVVRKCNFLFTQCLNPTLVMSYQVYAYLYIQHGIGFESWCLEWFYVSIEISQ